MALSPNTRLDHYAIAGPLGAGGMGEVYRARDTRLDREVAIKVLPGGFSADADRLRRFEQEARATSALNHPNILTVHDVGTHDGAPYIVSELLDGEELRAQLEDGPLPARKALDYASQIAAGLAAAHEKGIVHRDLKPENLFVTADGRVKILDFGLAKLRASGEHAGSQAPTERAMTDVGVVMGTVGYMSPEQIRGQEADPRSDIFSFGVILYEMLTGLRAFKRETQPETLTAILKEDLPELGESTVAAAGPVLEKIVRRCVEKKADRRFQTATDLRFAIEALSATAPRSEVGPPPPSAPGSAGRERLAWIAAVVSLLAALALGWAHFMRPPLAPPSTVKLHLPAPAGTSFATSAVSPDGRSVAFTAAAGGQLQLWVRSLDALESRALTGTEGATFPFWSPDSRFVAFFAGGKLKKVEISGGPPQTLTDAGVGWGGAWNRDGVILYGTVGFGLFRVASTGGPSTLVTQFDAARKEWNLSSPSFLPDGRHFLYHMQSAVKEVRGTYLGSLEGGIKQRILEADSNAVYAPSDRGDGTGYLLFAREGALVAQGFDAEKLKTTGEPFSVAERVGKELDFSRASFSVSDHGVLVYDPSTKRRNKRLVWVDRSGKPIRSLDAGSWGRPWLSPDEKRIAIDRADSDSGVRDIWLYDTSTGAPSRFTFDPGDDIYPVWSPDGSRIVWGSSREGVFDLYWKRSTGAGQDEPLLKSGILKVPNDWSLDGKFIIYYEVDPKTKRDLWVLPLEGDRKPFLFLRTEANDAAAQFSPDGRWVAYASDDSGVYEVFVRSFPDTGSKWQVSTRGGVGPVWRRDGKELFYYAPDGKLMSVEVRTGAGFESGVPTALFGFRPASLALAAPYTVAADGQHFVLNTVVDDSGNEPLTVVLNWTAGLRR